MANFVKCDKCGSILGMFVKGEGEVCSPDLLEIPVQTEGDKAPKHKPVVEVDGDKLTVKVGEVAHPMDDDHYIQFVAVEIGSELYAKCFKPGDVAEATFTIGADKSADAVAYAFCNLHGLWSSE
ncbi:MAG: desulfoferrodoxin [archaeon]|uniref:Superoxide reductase n=1 Tax=Methanobrevibacter gottschalkii DSM 11977 TaxID=1122229 RepID=A0A3N5B0F7_9EURY|nr:MULTISPECIES: desulfoferrodoxin family protein [Methanobrevibacter]MCQ2971353.1 desulfoferrodoxin [archaeon]OED00627.1 desulfoferrodoxin [Methanobrevibacter sp. A27]RPF50824.1 superoxide reductase [Methanobrevibacter gottschalkii DSM 11977]